MFVIDKPVPGVTAFAVDERCVDAAVLIFIFIPEYEGDFIIAPFALGNRGRETTAPGRIEPQAPVFVR